jgi:hypothetical protein
VSDSARLALFTEARDRAGRALVDRLLQALPDLAESLELAAERADSVAGRHELFSVAALLRMEAAVRARRARTDLFSAAARAWFAKTWSVTLSMAFSPPRPGAGCRARRRWPRSRRG